MPMFIISKAVVAMPTSPPWMAVGLSRRPRRWPSRRMHWATTTCAPWAPAALLLDALLGVIGSKVRINGLFHLLINCGMLGLWPTYILAFDPNFQRDISPDWNDKGIWGCQNHPAFVGKLTWPEIGPWKATLWNWQSAPEKWWLGYYFPFCGFPSIFRGNLFFCCSGCLNINSKGM